MGIKSPLYLTSFKSPSPVRVPAKHTEHLETHHISNVRFLYQNYQKSENIIFNNVDDMNEARSVSAFLNAFQPRNPTLVVCKGVNLFKWYYELTKIGNIKTFIVKDSDGENSDNFKDYQVILIPNTSLRLINNIGINRWFILVVEDIDLLHNSRYLKSINCEFKIGLTGYNFLMEPNTKLFWNIQRWANKNLVEDFENFQKLNKTTRRNFLKFYPNFWQRLTWTEMENLKPNILQKQEYSRAVSDWAIENDLTFEEKVFRKMPQARVKNTSKRSAKNSIEKKKKTKTPRNAVLKAVYQSRKRKTTSSSEIFLETQIKTEPDGSCTNNEESRATIQVNCNIKMEETEHSVFDILLGNKIETVTEKQESMEFKYESETEEGNPILDLLVASTSKEEIDLIENHSVKSENSDNSECMILNSLLQ